MDKLAFLLDIIILDAVSLLMLFHHVSVNKCVINFQVKIEALM